VEEAAMENEREVSVVVFDVATESDDYDTETIMLQLFGFTSAVRLQSASSVTYQSGDYDRRGQRVWAGRLDLIKSSRTSAVTKGRDGYRFQEKQEESVETSEATTFYAFDPSSSVFLYWDRAAMPYTRVVTYVRRAVAMDPEFASKVSVRFATRRIERTISEWVKQFSILKQLRAQYRHSQSPGERAVDDILETLNAETASESYRAPPGESLQIEAIANSQLPIARVLRHIEKNPSNGKVLLSGQVDDLALTVDTSNAVERHKISAKDNPKGIIGALTMAARTLLRLPTKKE
jgi:hypothetical protein